jgi:rod shape-determining protein MreC
MKRRSAILTGAGLQRIAVAALVLAHLVWVAWGRGPGFVVRRTLGLFTGPSERLAQRWEAWRAAREQRVRSTAEAQAEIQRLRQELDGARLREAQAAPKMAEAEEAVRLLGLQRQLPLELKAARILANIRNAPFGGLLIDRGRDLGLREDQGVIAPEGVVGRLWQVSATQSSVLPLDAYNASTSVMLGRSRATGVLQGTGPGRAEIRYISSQEVVQPGEPVFTSGLDRVFPRGLLVGHVASVRPKDIELRLEVSLAAPLDRLHMVLVLPPSPPLELQAPAPAPEPASPAPAARPSPPKGGR